MRQILFVMLMLFIAPLLALSQVKMINDNAVWLYGNPIVNGFLPEDKNTGLFDSPIYNTDSIFKPVCTFPDFYRGNKMMLFVSKGYWHKRDTQLLQATDLSLGEKPLDEQYLDWCELNKIIVGYRFILAETKSALSGTSSYFEVYDAKYAGKNDNYIDYLPVDFDDPFTVYFYWEKQLKFENPLYFQHQDYIRAEPIKRRTEPTFEGFIKWKRKFNKQ